MSGWFARNRHRYPDDWPAIATRVKDAATTSDEGGGDSPVAGAIRGGAPSDRTATRGDGEGRDGMSKRLPVLTLTEPWASLVASGTKTVETRSWYTSWRGPLLIHAAKGMTRDDLDVAQDLYADDPSILPGHRWLADDRVAVTRAFLDTRGRIIAVARLVRCEPTTTVQVTPDERQLGNFDPGRWAWVLEDVWALPEPVPARGELGLWQPTPGVMARIAAQRERAVTT